MSRVLPTATAAKKTLSTLLLAFVLISIGFAIGRETAPRAHDPALTGAAAATQPTTSDKVLVYYMHQTFRCVTCNQIEAMAHDVVTNSFAKELAGGTVEWKLANFQENEELAKRYNVVTSSVVVVRIKSGKEIAHQTLDELWTLLEKPDEFGRCVGNAIKAQLAREAI